MLGSLAAETGLFSFSVFSPHDFYARTRHWALEYFQNVAVNKELQEVALMLEFSERRDEDAKGAIAPQPSPRWVLRFV
jgi:hypothetical protein